MYNIYFKLPNIKIFKNKFGYSNYFTYLCIMKKDTVKQFKEKQQERIMNQELQKVRSIPVWKSNDKIEITGLEFEVLNNFITSAQGSFAALQSIMNRNILNGTIKVDFEKLNDTNTGYVPMTDEEKAPHIAEYNTFIEAAKQQLSQPQSEQKISDSDEQQTKTNSL